MDDVFLRTLLRGILTPAWMARSKRKTEDELRSLLSDAAFARGPEDQREDRDWIVQNRGLIVQVAGQVARGRLKFTTDDGVNQLMEERRRVLENVVLAHCAA